MIATMVEHGAAGDELERLLADLDGASGDCQRALPRYLELLRKNSNDGRLAEAAAISALRCGRISDAERMLTVALASEAASWRAWNAKGVLSDLRRQWNEADAAYAKAAALQPASAQIATNRGWSLLLRGRWGDAVPELERAVRLDPKLRRAQTNLELAQSALQAGLPGRRPGESEKEWAARLNDTGVIAHLSGDRQKAVAAFSQAIEARSDWFERAANNLKLSEVRK